MIPVIALILAFAIAPPTISEALCLSAASSETVANQIPSPTAIALADNIKVLDKSSQKFTAQSLAGEYIMVIGDVAKREMERSGIKEFKAKLVLKADGTFEGWLIISGVSFDAKDKPKTSEVRAKGEFKIEGNKMLLTTKYQMVDGKEEKASPAADKYIISADGKELKPEDEAGISFIKKVR